MKAVSIILPTYNERDNIEELIRDILNRVSPSSEVVVVDDDSPDGTGQIVQRLSLQDPRVHLIRRKERRGLTLSLRSGIEAARHRTVIWMDADFAHPPALLPELIGQPEDFDIVVASRYVPGGSDGRSSFLRRGISRALNRVGRRYLRSAVRDLTSGYLRVKKDIFRELPLRGEYGDYCIDFLIRAEKMGYQIKEIPFSNADRREGQSKTASNPLIFSGYALLYIRTLMKLKKYRSK